MNQSLQNFNNIAIHKTKPATVTAGTVKNDFKGTTETFASINTAFSFISSTKETIAYCKLCLYDVKTIVKQLATHTYFLTLSRADLRWKEFPYIINKLNNLVASDDQLKN